MVTLYAHAIRVNDELAEAVLVVVPPEDRPIVKDLAAALGELEEIQELEGEAFDLELEDYVGEPQITGDVLGSLALKVISAVEPE